MPGAPLLAALIAVTGVASLEGLEAAIRERFPAAVAEGNIAAARAAYEGVMASA
jgi:pyruvate ferredoxin oxidoreductase gamma subunit